MPTPLMEIRNATKIYGGGFLQGGDQVVALQDFNLTIYDDPATITTIAGESGSGKTTLANLVLGFITLTSGQVIYQRPGRRHAGPPGAAGLPPRSAGSFPGSLRGLQSLLPR